MIKQSIASNVMNESRQLDADKITIFFNVGKIKIFY